MECKNCGRKSMNENANYCDYCGASFREGIEYYPAHENVIVKEKQEQERNTAQSTTAPKGLNAIFGDGSKPMSFWNWVAVFSILLLPYAGPLLFVVFLIIWAFDRRTPDTRKNFARAFLIFLIIGLIYLIFMAAMMFASMDDPNAWLEQYMKLYGM